MELALLVDEVLEITSFPASQIQEAGSLVRGIRGEYLLGIASRMSELSSKDQDEEMKTNEVLVIILDLPALLAHERMVIHEEIV